MYIYIYCIKIKLLYLFKYNNFCFFFRFYSPCLVSVNFSDGFPPLQNPPEVDVVAPVTIDYYNICSEHLLYKTLTYSALLMTRNITCLHCSLNLFRGLIFLNHSMLFFQNIIHRNREIHVCRSRLCFY